MSSQVSTRVVIQAADTACLLVDNKEKTVTMPTPGVIIYVSFLKNSTKKDVAAAVNEILTAKIFPLQHNIALWKNKGSDEDIGRPKPMSLAECTDANVMIIPQATLAGKLKAKTMQYHAQCDKKDAEALFTDFCQLMREALAVSYEVDGNGAPQKEEPFLPRLVLNGTFGNRQGLQLSSPGPFTHVLEF